MQVQVKYLFWLLKMVSYGLHYMFVDEKIFVNTKYKGEKYKF